MIATLTFIVAVVTGVWGRTRGFLFLWVVLLSAWLAASPPSLFDRTAQATAPVVAKACVLVHRFSWQPDPFAVRQVVDWLQGGCANETPGETGKDAATRKHKEPIAEPGP